jgi:CHAT domain-containing protein
VESPLEPPQPTDQSRQLELEIATIVEPDPTHQARILYNTEQDRETREFYSSSELIGTIVQVKTILENIEQEAGVKPAVIYASFVPPGFRQRELARQEASLTEEYENFLNLPEDKAPNNFNSTPQAQDRLELLLITSIHEKPIRIQVDVTRQEILTEAGNLYERVSSFEDGYLEPSQKLYQWLIKPLETYLVTGKIENILFIMPPGLRTIPIAALHDGEKFLAQKYSSGFTPSLSLTDPRYRSIKSSSVLAFGASEFEEEEKQSPLAAVQVEVAQVTSQKGGQFYLNQDFTLEKVKQKRANVPYPIVHLATHADFQTGGPENTYIQLYDQKMSLEQLRELKLYDPQVELLILSACRTAYGDENVELGFGGLAVQAGVKSVIASLWYVGDTATLGLMNQIYQELKQSPIKAEALRKAQTAMIEGKVRKENGQIIYEHGTTIDLPEASARGEEDFSHPFYWAPFTLIGSPW